MATFAAATERVRIASDVVVLPFAHPVLLAKTIASLDVLSGGRLTLGVGVGGDYASEYAAMAGPAGRARRAALTRAWRSSAASSPTSGFSYAGRYFTIEDVGIAPRPLQQPYRSGSAAPRRPPSAALRGSATAGSAAFASERKFARLVGDLHGFLAGRGRPAAEPHVWGASCSSTWIPTGAGPAPARPPRRRGVPSPRRDHRGPLRRGRAGRGMRVERVREPTWRRARRDRAPPALRLRRSGRASSTAWRRRSCAGQRGDGWQDGPTSRPRRGEGRAPRGGRSESA